MEKALTGVRVLDVSRWFAGPYAATLLAAEGADVIRIERPTGEEERHFGPFAPNGESMLTKVTLQNRRGVTLDITSEKGRAILHQLVKQADVVLHSYVVGSEEAKILSYDALKTVNPKIIVASVSGFGSTGPYANRPCFDTIAQALSGAMSYTGFPGGPPMRAGVAWVDYGAGINTALGIMFALYHRKVTGKGQAVEVALMDVAVSCVAGLAVPAEYKIGGIIRKQQGNHSYYCITDCFQAKDGWVMIGVTGNPIWRRFARALGMEEFRDDPRFKDDNTRFQNRELVQPLVRKWVGERTVAQVVEALDKARVPCSQVYNIAQMVDDPHVKARGTLVELEYPRIGKVPVPATPIRMSETPGSIDRRAPEAGEHNEEVYGGLLGLTPTQLAQLKAEGII
ncbi:MAG: CoA transferase [Chloroflexi bacterium]|nr:CoA transferase [Chloroflexota bacterium]